MSSGLTAEHRELGQVVARFLSDVSTEEDVRRLMETQSWDPAVWKRMADELGLQGLVIPERFGGSGFGWEELIVVLEEMGEVLLCSPYFSTVVLGASALIASEDEDAQAVYLPEIASGRLLATVCLTNEAGDWAVTDLVAEREAGNFVLNGIVPFVTDGTSADLLLVAANVEGSPSLFGINHDAAGVTCQPLPVMDETRPIARIEFADAPARLIGELGSGGDTLARVRDLASIGLAAEQTGGAARCLRLASEYAKTRVQFGRPIGSFQAIKHKLADMLVDVESARSVVQYAAWCVEERPEEVPLMAAAAQACSSDVYVRAAGDNIQIHGGIGFTWEHPAHLYFKRAKASSILFGDARQHREAVAQLLGV